MNKQQSEKKISSFLRRLFSGLVLLIMAIFLLSYGGFPLFSANLLLSLVALYELYRVFGIEKKPPGVIGYLMVVSYYFLLLFNKERYLTLVIILSLMCLLFLYVIKYPSYHISLIGESFLSIVYAGIMMSYIFKVRCLPNGIYLIWLIFLSAWGTDTSAYCIGLLFGTHHMTPVLSPKKTVEGAIGGVLGAAVLGALFGFALGCRLTTFNHPVIVCAFSCIIASVISMAGDLAASGIKRDFGIKDYGDLIPGHGGILDRFDSILFTAPTIYFLVLLIGEFQCKIS